MNSREQEALKILDSVCAQVNLTRQQHVEVQQAVTILAQAINPKPDSVPMTD